MHFPLELKAQLPCQCTRKFTGDKPTIQRYCHCLTCGIGSTSDDKRAICEPCAYACHAGHLFCYAGTGPVVCSCGIKEDVKKPKKSKGKVSFNVDDDETNVCVCFDQPVEEVIFDAENEEEEEEANDDADNDNPHVELTPCFDVTNIPYSCTLSQTKDNFFLQHNYRCLTCHQKTGEAVCAVCARICHAGHQLQDNGITPFYCDCGSNAIPSLKCQCMFKNKSQNYQYTDSVTCLPFEIPLKCTSEFEKKADGSKRPFIQRGFLCQTCNSTEENPICEACAIKCHNGHQLVDLKMKQFICSCSSANCKNDTDEKYVPSICAEEGLNSYNCGCEYLDAENSDHDDDHQECECHHHHHHS